MASRILRTRLIMLTLIIAILALFGITLSCGSFSPAKAPDFTLPTMAGASITLSELEGTPVVINFWATWCTYCVAEMNYFDTIAREREGEIKVIAINVGDSVSKVQQFFGAYEPTMIVALDGNGAVFEDYCKHFSNPRFYIPFTLFVDIEGIVRQVNIGAFQSEADLRNTLDSVF